MLLIETPLDVQFAIFDYFTRVDVLDGPLSRSCRALRDACRHQTYLASIKQLSVTRPISLAAPFPNMRRLNCSITLPSDACERLIEHVAAGSPLLTHLTLAPGCRISVGTLGALLKGCPLISHLSLQHCDVRDEHMSLISQIPLLVLLDLTGCDRLSDRGIARLTQGCPNIHTLVLSGCTKLTDATIEHVSDGCKLIDYAAPADLHKSIRYAFEVLQILDMSQTRISDTGLEFLSEKCPSVHTLIAFRCLGLTVSAIQALVQTRQDTLIVQHGF